VHAIEVRELALVNFTVTILTNYFNYRDFE